MEKKAINIHSELIGQCKKGNTKAQFEIYKLYYKAMYNSCLRIVNNENEAEDVMQEAFLSAFEKINTYKDKVSFGAWLKRIVINKSIDAIRKRRIIFESIEDKEIEQEQELSAEEFEKIKTKADKIKEKILELKDNYRLVLSLNLLEGYDHGEISQILSIPESTSRAQLTRAKQKLRNLLGES